jgi:hypothetical protein
MEIQTHGWTDENYVTRKAQTYIHTSLDLSILSGTLTTLVSLSVLTMLV